MSPIPMAAAEAVALQYEHGVLLRRLGQLQRELGSDLARLERENLRLRAALLLARTAWLWGVAPPPDAPARELRAVEASAAPATVQQLLCQVACTGHAHRWLGADGLCSRSGEACERLAASR